MVAKLMVVVARLPPVSPSGSGSGSGHSSVSAPSAVFTRSMWALDMCSAYCQVQDFVCNLLRWTYLTVGHLQESQSWTEEFRFVKMLLIWWSFISVTWLEGICQNSELYLSELSDNICQNSDLSRYSWFAGHSFWSSGGWRLNILYSVACTWLWIYSHKYLLLCFFWPTK